MRRLLGILCLLLQFGPFAGAGLCMHAAAQPKSECEMPVQDSGHETGKQHSPSTHGCAQMAICASVAPIMPVAVELTAVTHPRSADYSNPALLLAGDPITPPQPPPIV